MHSSLLTLQISLNIPHLTLPGSRVGRGAYQPPFYIFIIHYKMVQAAKLWLPELSANILVKKKIMPRLPLSCCDLFVVRIKKDAFPFIAYSMLLQNIIWKPKTFLLKSLLGSILFLLNKQSGGKGGKFKNNHHTPSITYTAYHPQIYTLIGFMSLCVQNKYYSYTPQTFRSIRRI